MRIDSVVDDLNLKVLLKNFTEGRLSMMADRNQFVRQAHCFFDPRFQEELMVDSYGNPQRGQIIRINGAVMKRDHQGLVFSPEEVPVFCVRVDKVTGRARFHYCFCFPS